MDYIYSGGANVDICLLSVCEVLRHVYDGIHRHTGADGVVMATDDARRERYELH